LLSNFLKILAIFSIKKNLLINALPNVIFEALTNSDKIIRYYPLKEVVSTWEVGGDILLKGSNGGKDFVEKY